MKKPQLKLNELKVQSFVTDFDKAEGQTHDVNGGATFPNACHITVTLHPICPVKYTRIPGCPPLTVGSNPPLCITL